MERICEYTLLQTQCVEKNGKFYNVYLDSIVHDNAIDSFKKKLQEIIHMCIEKSTLEKYTSREDHRESVMEYLDHLLLVTLALMKVHPADVYADLQTSLTLLDILGTTSHEVHPEAFNFLTFVLRRFCNAAMRSCIYSNYTLSVATLRDIVQDLKDSEPPNPIEEIFNFLLYMS